MRRLAALVCGGAIIAFPSFSEGNASAPVGGVVSEAYEAPDDVKPLLAATMGLADQVTLDYYMEGLIYPYRASKQGNICKTDPFYDQPKVTFCSAFLVAPDLVVSAGHCFHYKPLNESRSCDETKVIAGFYYQTRSHLVDMNMASCRMMLQPMTLAQPLNPDQRDWAIFRLSRRLKAPNFKIDFKDDLEPGTPIALIGYPHGIPAKISLGVVTNPLRGKNVFIASLNSFPGDSGGIVFDRKTRRAVGIVVDENSSEYIKDTEKVDGREVDCWQDLITNWRESTVMKFSSIHFLETLLKDEADPLPLIPPR